jgi:trans-2,3-dihydro-3-hydroxyanthranilate isomerase
MTQTKSYPYTVVDVFTTEPLSGNSLAVFPEASEFDAAAMQKIARELNLTETAFVLPPTRSDCAARVRIFTPTREMAFAGHPTVGTAFVLLHKGIVPSDSTEFLLEEEVGPVPIRVERGQHPLICLRTPPIHEGRCFDGALCARALGLKQEDLLPLTPQLLSAGNPTLLIAVKDKAAVDRASLNLKGLSVLKGAANELFCVFLFATTPDGAYSRMFAPDYGIPEDPATGSSTGPLAVFMIRQGLLSSAAGTRFVSEQGTRMGRRSLLHVELCGENGTDGIYVGGHVTPIIEAVMNLPSRC